MQYVRVRCPHCSMILDIPESYTGSKIRCGNCQKGFGLPSFSDKDILETIVDPERVESFKPVAPENELDKEIAGMISPELLEEPEAREPEALLDDEATDDETPDKPMFVAAESDHLPTGFTVLDINRLGVFFEFPASLLEDDNFRGKMPKSCVRCGATSYLNTHLVVFEHDLHDVVTVENNHVPTRIELKDRDIKRMSPAELLGTLPNLEKLDPPLNRAMPFWVCDLCDPARLVYARGEINKETGEGICRIRIKRYKIAEEFVCNIGGKHS